jgi:hypothetical protein
MKQLRAFDYKEAYGILSRKTQLTGKVIFRGQPGYNQALLNWNPRLW